MSVSSVLALACSNHRLTRLTENNMDMVCVLEGVDLCDICVTLEANGAIYNYS
jgi:hypothetical protein